MKKSAYPYFILLFSLMSFFIFGCVSGISGKDLAKELYNLGNEYYSLGKWDKAGEFYSKSLKYDPQLANASFNMARALTESGNFNSALEIVEKLINDDSENAEFLSLKAYIFYKSGQFNEALEIYNIVAQMNIYDFSTMLNQSMLLLKIGNLDEARDILVLLEKDKPDDKKVIKSLSIISYLQEDWVSAEKYLSIYQTIILNDKEAMTMLARVYEKLERYKDAMDQLDILVKIDPKNKDAWFDLAYLRLVIANDDAGGLEALKKAIDNGFTDEDKIKGLLEEPKLVSRDEVISVLKNKKLIN